MFDFLAPLWNLVIYDPMLNGLLLLYSWIPSYGVAIILFTLIVAGITMPLRIQSQRAMRKQQEKQARLKPKLDELKKKHKDDQRAYQEAQMKLYQEEGLVNPLNSGCLLTLIPFPIFIGLYNVITSVMGNTPEQLLSLSSHLYSFFPKAGALVPVNPYFFGLNLAAAPSTQNIIVAAIMVVLVVGVQWVQQKMMTLPAASLDPQQAAMNQQMQLMMPLFFGWIVWGTPAGLSLYWITFGLLTVGQQYFTSGWGSLFSRSAPKTDKPKRLSASSPSNDSNESEEKTVVESTPTASVSKKDKKKRGKKY